MVLTSDDNERILESSQEHATKRVYLNYKPLLLKALRVVFEHCKDPTANSTLSDEAPSTSSRRRTPILWSPSESNLVFAVSLNKDPDQGFGMVLRRGLYVERRGVTLDGQFLEFRTQALFSEPGPSGVSIGLLPGDRLVAVNDTDTQHLPLTDVVQLIRTFGSSVTLSVKPSPELLEFSERTFGCLPMPNIGEKGASNDSEYLSISARAMIVRPKVIHAGGFTNLYMGILETLYGMYLHRPSEPALVSFSNYESPKNYSTPASSSCPLGRLGDTSYVTESEENIPVWLSTRDGYKAATLLNCLPNGRGRILILPEQEELEVDTEYLERSNPATFDHIEDVADLRYLNECSLTHTLIQRFGSGQVCTYASGAYLLMINPMTRLNIYSEAVMDLFSGCQNRRDMPPHIFSIAQLTLARLNRSAAIAATHPHAASKGGVNGYSVQTGTSTCSGFPESVFRQAICFAGRSGSGKSRASLDLLSYLLNQSNRVMAANFQTDGQIPLNFTRPRITAERLRALFSLLDAFTSSRILLNTNASRTIRLFSVEFTDIKSTVNTASHRDSRLVISGLTTRLLLFDRTRVTERPEGEPNFHIFYYFLAGLDSTSRRELFLTDLDEPNLFMTKLHRTEDKEAAQHHWSQLCMDAQLLDFDLDKEWLTGGISRLLAVIYHLGCAGCVDNKQSCNSVCPNDPECPPHIPGFLNLESAHRAAYLLGCPLDYLTTAVFGIPEQAGRTAMDSLRAFIQGLYQTTVDILLMLINRCLSSESSASHNRTASTRVCAQLVICDPPGLQAPSPNPRCGPLTSPALGSYADLLINYANERLTVLSHQTGVELCKSMMRADGLTVPDDAEAEDKPMDIVGTLDGSSTADDPSSRGIFRLIEDAAPTDNVKGLLEKLEELYQKERNLTKNRDLRSIRRCRRSGSFILNHSLSTFPVEYGVDTRWLTNCYLCPAVLNAYQLLRRHGPSSIVRLASLLQFQRDYLGDAKPTWTEHVSVFVDAKQQLDFLTNLLHACATKNASPNPHLPDSGFNDGGSPSGLHWIHCLLPVINAGLCQLSSEGDGSLSSGRISYDTTSKPSLLPSPARICVNLIRAQLRGLNLTSLLREVRRSYPDRLSLKKFGRRYASLVTEPASAQLSAEQFAKAILSALHYAPQFYAIGKQQDRQEPTTNVMSNRQDADSRIVLVSSPQVTAPNNFQESTETSLPSPKQRQNVNLNGSFDAQHYVEMASKVEQTSQALMESYAEIERLNDRLFHAHSEVDKLYGQCHDAENRALEAKQRADAAISEVGRTQQPPLVIESQYLRGTGDSQSVAALENEVNGRYFLFFLFLQSLRSKLAQSKAKQKELEAALSEARAQLDATDCTDSPTLITELNELRKSRQDLLNQVATLQSELEEAKEDIACTKREYGRLEQDLERVQADSYRIMEERDSEFESLRKLNQAKTEELERQLDSMLTEASKATQERMRLQHDLEAAKDSLASVQEAATNEAERKLRAELQRYEDLLSEKQAVLEQLLQQPSADPRTTKQLRDRVDELEELNEKLTRQNRALQVQLDELQNQLSGLQTSKEKLENEISSLNREVIDLAGQVEEQKEITKEAQRQHHAAVTARQVDATTLREQTREINELLAERDQLRTEVHELQSKLSPADAELNSRVTVDRLEAKIRELEQRLEAEVVGKSRLQTALDRSREAVEKLTFERDRLLESEKAEKEQNRKILRQLRQAQQAHDETARRVQLAQRRADDALSQADLAIKQADSSRTQLDAMAKRTQELEAWINRKQLCDSDDETFPSFVSDEVRKLRRLGTASLETCSNRESGSIRKQRGPLVRSRSLVFERARHPHPHANQIQKLIFRRIPRTVAKKAQPSAQSEPHEPVEAQHTSNSSISSVNVAVTLRPSSASRDARSMNAGSTLTDITSKLDTLTANSDETMVEEYSRANCAMIESTDSEASNSLSKIDLSHITIQPSERDNEDKEVTTTPPALGTFVRSSVRLHRDNPPNITAVIPEPRSPADSRVTSDRAPVVMIYESTVNIPRHPPRENSQMTPVVPCRRSTREQFAPLSSS
ncbi:myosin-XVIIIb [Clonorchis sinensis]|uniref:Myosin-XVIIIb n=1 Tax=Clonorchis sinensis TaxID=79923 RepID=G7YFQ4_CLOSI|nr:myosin-XVIIIb [Clonorchis sinensis]